MNILIIGSDKLTNAITVYNETHTIRIKKIIPRAKITVTEDKKLIDKLLPETDIIITSPFKQNLIDLDLAKKLKWVHVSSAGVTDMAKFLAETDILLTNSSGVHPIPISEHVFGMLLMFARKFNRTYERQIKEKKWKRDLEELQMFELYGKTLGIVGYGRIGAQIATLAKGFNMRVAALAHTKKINDKNVDISYRMIDLLLNKSDFVIDALPLTDETQGYFDSSKFKQMKSSAYFVNIGRGKTVVETDLIKALKTNVIAGAGLDVLEEEPTPNTNPLWKLPNVIISPHVSGWTPEYTNRVTDIFCVNLKAYQKKRTMPNLVDKTRGY